VDREAAAALPGAGRDEPSEALRRLERTLEGLGASGDLALPPYPAVALRVREVMARRSFGLGEVADLIGADAMLAADILRCANSVMYRRGAPVIDLTQALTRIGVQEVMRLLLVSGLAVQAQAVGPLVLLRRMYWIEGLAGAVVSQELARLRGLRIEDAFTLGLLHDCGKIVAVSGLEALLQKENLTGGFPREAWEALVERQHQALGRLMAARWRLPPLVGEVIALHHGAQGACSDPRLLEVVRASDQVVALLLARARVTEADLATLDLVKAGEREAVSRVVEQIPDFVAAFETSAAAAAVPSPPVSQPETTLAGDQRPVAFGVSVSVARRPRLFTAQALGPAGLVMSGEEPLPENRLLEAKLYGPRPFTVWVLTRQCRHDGARYRLEVQPFALSGPLREEWERLVLGEPPTA
jgi:HD-like signal output (HDOD) protein